ncbi:MAG: hypothetical protein JNJ59_08575 [Deltaproteobacteria bacterium]|nr:hypothetical protein [Deltaproteobacteria bacterium]
MSVVNRKVLWRIGLVSGWMGISSCGAEPSAGPVGDTTSDSTGDTGDSSGDGTIEDVTACDAPCPGLGESSCIGAGYRTCSLDARGCLVWGPELACPGTTTCSLGACSSECQDECDEGVAVCEGNAVRGCGQFDADPCRDLGPATACDGRCVDGACASGCDDECPSAGLTECVGAGTRSCGNFDGDACLEWSSVVACGGGSECIAASCEAGRCVTVPTREGEGCGGAGCTSGGTCQAGSCVGATGGCGPGEACVGGTCQCSTAFDGSNGLVSAALDVPVVDVVFSMSINGVPTPASLPFTEKGSLWVKHRSSTEWTLVGEIGGALDGPTWRLIPGEYDVEYRKASTHTWREGILTPENDPTLYRTITIPAAGGTVPIDLPATDVSFEARINGVPAPKNLPANERGTLRVKHPGATKWIVVGELGGEMRGPSWRLIPGRYQYQYQKVTNYTWREGILTPENGATVVGEVEIPSAGGVVAIDVPAATVVFEARMNGQPAPQNLAATERGVLHIRHRGATEWIAVGELGGPMLGPNWRLIAGTYDVEYRKAGSHTWREGILTPENEATLFATIQVPPVDGTIAIDLHAADATFEARLNGQPAPRNLPTSQQGVLRIKHRGSTAWTVVGALGGEMIGPSWRLITGTYDVQYSKSAGYTWVDGVLAPENEPTQFGTLVVPEGGGALRIEIYAATVTFTVKINGVPAPTNLPSTEQGRLELRHRGATAWTTLGMVGGAIGGPSWRLITGSYDYRYTRSTTFQWREGVLAPENGATLVGTFEVPANGGPLVLEVPAADIAFSGKINGVPAPTNLPQSEWGLVSIVHEGSTEEIDLGAVGGPFTGPSWRLLTGTYRVRYERGNTYQWREGILAPENKATAIGCFELVGP